MGYDRIRPSLDIEPNLKSGIVRGGRSQVLEEEQREREKRVRTQAKKLKNDAEQVRQDKQADQ